MNFDTLLCEVREFFRRFCVFPDEHCLTAVTLWAVHTHIVEHLHSTPRLALISPEASSGKTRVLEVLELLVPNRQFSLSASPAAIFRSLAQTQLTLLFDEVDTIWSGKGKNDGNEDLRALLNAGYKRGAKIPRCVGSNHEVRQFSVYCAVALAGLGDLPETIMSRSVIIRMRRRAPGESIEPFRSRLHEEEGHALRDRLAAWASDHGAAVGQAFPTLPEGIVDRPAEVWEPLIAVADAGGLDWGREAREACLALCRVAENRTVSLGMRLLADLRIIFGDEVALHTQTILDRLTSEATGLDDDAPWADLRGDKLRPPRLAKLLKRYGIAPTQVNIGGRSLKGYRREDLWDAWQRYLPRLDAATAISAEAKQAKQAEQAEQAEPQSESGLNEFQAGSPSFVSFPSAGGKESCPSCNDEGCYLCGVSDYQPDDDIAGNEAEIAESHAAYSLYEAEGLPAPPHGEQDR